jgi:cell division protein FtsQ
MDDPWISKLYLQKTIPDLLKVLVIEHTPFALFTSDYKKYILVNEFGEKINIPEVDIINFRNLFIVVDDSFDPKEMEKMFNILSNYANVARRVSAFIRVGDRRWDLRLRNNVLVKMPEDGEFTMVAWAMLSDLLGVYGLDIGLEEIDLRIGKKAFLKYKHEVKEKINQFSKGKN